MQDGAREDDLSPSPCGAARSKTVSDDRLVSEERVLHAGLSMIARRLLPASPSSLLDRQDRAITSARPRSVSRHVGRTRRRNHDGGATRTGGFVKADRIVGGIRRHLSEGAVDRLDQRDASRRVVDARLRQGPGDDHTRPVDTEMPRLPASPPPSSMFRRGPFTLAHEREARAVDNEMQAGTCGGATQREVEMLATPGERREVDPLNWTVSMILLPVGVAR